MPFVNLPRLAEGWKPGITGRLVVVDKDLSARQHPDSWITRALIVKRSGTTQWRFVHASILVFFFAVVVRAGDNLVVNGDFETADPARPGAPLGWERPDGLGVQWTNSPSGHGLAMRLDTRVSERDMNASWARAGLTNDWFIPNAEGNAIAETYGLSYYSMPFPVASGVTYRVTCDVWGPGGAKVWVRGYGLFRGQKARRYETVLICYGGGDAWRTCAQTFNPTLHRPDVTEMKVMLYAYYPSGVYWFDHVRVEAVKANEEPRQGSGASGPGFKETAQHVSL